MHVWKCRYAIFESWNLKSMESGAMQYQRLTEMICPPGLVGLWRGFSDSTVLFKPPEETQELAQFLPRRSYERGFLELEVYGLGWIPHWLGSTPPHRWEVVGWPWARLAWAAGPLMPRKALRIPCSKPRTCGRSMTAAQVECCEWTQ